jgi:hypothetical protein
VAEAAPCESIAAARAIDRERRALDRLPPGDAADRHSEFVAGQLRRREALDTDPRDPAEVLRDRTRRFRNRDPRRPAARNARSISSARTSLSHPGSSSHASSCSAGSYE